MQQKNLNKVKPIPVQSTRATQESKMTMMHERKIQSGPIPDPETLQKYEAIMPGIANRIMLQAEKEQEHRHSIETSILNGQETQHRRDTITYRFGQFGGAFAVTICVLLCAFCVFKGYPTQAASLGGVIIVGVALAFITGKSNSPEPNKEKGTGS